MSGSERGAVRYLAALVAIALAAVLYLVPNRIMAGQAVLLPMIWFDQIVPFWPWTGWLYLGAYMCLVPVYIGLRDPGDGWRFLGACLLAQVVAACVFVAWPTQYPRELFPIPPGTAAANAALVGFFRGIDAPVNCLPSLHVSSTFLCAAACSRDGLRPARPFMIAAAPLLMLSTMTFKQHYFADVLAGLALGALSYAICFRARTGHA